MYLGGAKVLDGDTYLLPWDRAARSSTTTTPRRHDHLAGARGLATTDQFTVYKLTDNGRVKVGTVTAEDGKITLTATAGQPYVLYPDQAPQQADPDGARAARSRTPASTRST